MGFGGELIRNNGAVLLLFRRELPFGYVPRSKVLCRSQGLNHPRDEGLVLPLLHSSERHKSWDGPCQQVGPELDNAKGTPDLGPWHTGVEALVDASQDVET